MLRRIRERLTYANVIATIALFAALGGTSYAALALPRNSVGSAHLRQGSVRSSEVKDRSLRVRDLSRRTRRALRGARGPAGPQGPPGVTQLAPGTPGAAPIALTYKAVAATVAAAPNADTTVTAAATATCDAGQHVTGGGVRLENIDQTSVHDAYPGPGGTTWTAHVGNDDTASAHGFTVFAVCVPSAVTG